MRILLALLALLSASPALAAAETVTTVYRISLLGLPVGRAEFKTRIDGQRYQVSGTLSSAGLAELVSSTRGTSSVSGSIRPDRLEAERYRLDYTSDGKAWKSDVRYQRGRALSATVAPPIRNPPPVDFVAVTPAQLRRVVDPLSGLMLKPADANKLCAGAVPFYDGWSRLDLVLSPNGRDDFRADGFEGEAVVCNVRVRPVSGYRTSSKGLKYLADKTLQIWFAPSGRSGIYAPVYVRIPTEVGPLTLTATTFAKP
ncbi:DUF3108 domain-containing protein [Aureimonas sp. AU4]|uniref:DUF3108 domain-containing protein n=1 Tax=Aureimonas sp. AU4 TaxID=1638163 RepID=UPI0007866CD1|nr:DUF3108 domain-containing protein [Aureimonas sp. AU4]